MSFLRRQVGKRESMGGGAKGKNLNMTASTAIDPLPLSTSLSGDDIPDEACNNRNKRSIPAAHVIPMAHLQLEGLFQEYFLRFSSPYEKSDTEKMGEERGG